MRTAVVRARALAGAIRLVHGPPDVACTADDVVVLCLVRNGEVWLPSFVQHHLDLGVKHIFFLDNASTDRTLELARSFDRVSVYRTDISFKHWEIGMRRWLTGTLGRNRWSLHLDVDELFDFPGSGRIGLNDLLGYLREGGYKAVVAHMLDMFSDRPFSRLESSPLDDLLSKYPFYDLRDVVRTRDVYWIRNGQLRDPDVVCTFNGIRSRLFGSRCLCQSKHPLLFADSEVDPFRYDGHFAAAAPVADISCVLLHYKYVSRLGEQARENVEEGQHWSSSQHYEGIYQVLANDPDFTMFSPHAHRLENIDQLVEEGFLTVSERYARFIAAHSGQSAGTDV